MPVDDNVDGAETLARLLGAHGHEVRVFHEPIAALDAVREFRPDLAVLDIGLPVLDGYELARRMRVLLDGQPGGPRRVPRVKYRLSSTDQG
jgi:DNA-binding response OmpR family regulator